ncbi:MAG TPA: EAL domain-containing protein [Steroidobacteraceae bacterium]|nr:EAL domain-containing protein [Steroidobacteraceae bacterium]
MRAAAIVPASSRTRVARRVFLLCALCALLPTVVIGTLVYTRIATQEESAARSILLDGATRYGMLLNERLNRAEEDLIDLAQRRLQGLNPGLDASAATRIEAVVYDDSREAVPLQRDSHMHPVGPLRVRDESLRIVEATAGPVAELTLGAADAAGRRVRVSGRLRPEYLWNADVVQLPGARACVSVDAQDLHCEGDVLGDEPSLRESWNLFLTPHFGVPGWNVSLAQPQSLALARLASFRQGLPLLAAAALLVALLASSFEVRRAHRPLSELLEAFRAMSRGRFRRISLAARRDEYGGIGRAFNQLSRTLRRQLRLLSTLERMDQSILEHPSVAGLVDSMLPALPAVLDCQCVGIIVSGATGGMLFCHADASLAGQAQSGTARDPASALALLRERRPDLHWEEIPLRVAGAVRGWLACGRLPGAATPRAIRRQAHGVARRFAVALRNEERERQLLRQALVDELTQLPNRRMLQDRVQQALVEAAAANEKFAFVYLDLDRFKTLNDSLGHRCGDELLFQLAARLAGWVRPGDTVARIGGDEFVLLMRDVTAAIALQRLAEVQRLLREPVHVGGATIQSQASIGIAMHPANGADYDVLLRNADLAMYRGKNSGGGRMVFFQEEMNEQARRRLQVESGLRQALGAGRLQLHFQPKVTLPDGAPHGMEGLLRWNDPVLGWVGPDEFIPVAEESELIQELGRFALERAVAFCRQCMDADAPVGHVAVNASMLQLCDAGLVDFIARTLSRHHVPPAMLQIEVTESSLMRDVAMVSEVLRRIRALGIRIAIDDFGTGYSSLAVLQTLPVDLLKIDRSFIARLGESTGSLELVRAMISVGRALGLATIAEGVETQAQHEQLVTLGCDHAQGYRYSRALPEPEALALIRGGRLRTGPAPWIMHG